MAFGRRFSEIVALAVEHKDTFGPTEGIHKIFNFLGELYHSGYGLTDPIEAKTAMILAKHSTTFNKGLKREIDGDELYWRANRLAAVGMLLKIYVDRGISKDLLRDRAVFESAVYHLMAMEEIRVPEFAVETAMVKAEDTTR